jgi:hypothetical protein
VDDLTFDRLTRLLSTSSRRDTLRAALGALLGVALLVHPAHVGAGAGKDRRPRAASEGTASAGGTGNGAGILSGGGTGGQHGKHGRRHRHAGHGGNNRGQHKRTRDDECAKAGQHRKLGKPCCKGLSRDSTGRCRSPQSLDSPPGEDTGGSGDSNQPGGGNQSGGASSPPGGGAPPPPPPPPPPAPVCAQECSRFSATCCADGFCSCGGTCCGTKDCFVYTACGMEHELCQAPGSCEKCVPSGADSCDCEPVECPGSFINQRATIRRR